MPENHPYPPFFDKNSRVLIIGTTPPMRFTHREPSLSIESDDVDFFYGSRDNYFWNLMGDVFGIKFSTQNSDHAINQRKSFLKEHQIGLADIVLEFTRRDDNASDDNLVVSKYQNIYEILRNNIQINKIFFTGYSGSKSAESHTSKHLGEYNVFNTIVNHLPPKHKTFKIDNRSIDSFSLFSPSPAARKTYAVLLEQYKQYLNDYR